MSFAENQLAKLLYSGYYSLFDKKKNCVRQVQQVWNQMQTGRVYVVMWMHLDEKQNLAVAQHFMAKNKMDYKMKKSLGNNVLWAVSSQVAVSSNLSFKFNDFTWNADVDEKGEHSEGVKVTRKGKKSVERRGKKRVSKVGKKKQRSFEMTSNSGYKQNRVFYVNQPNQDLINSIIDQMEYNLKPFCYV